MRIAGYEVLKTTQLDDLRGDVRKLQDKVNGLRSRLATREVGGTGTDIYGGFLDEEWNTRLTGTQWYSEVDKMRLSDAQVQATLLSITLPIRAADWSVKPASEDKKDVEIARYVEDNLMGGMIHSWDDFLRQALLYLAYGSMGFEKIYRLEAGKYRFHKFAPRLPETFYRYEVDPATEELTAIEQKVTKADKYLTVPIPASRLMLFVHNWEGANYRGWGILRAAWKHWKIKDMLYRVHAIGFERFGIGIPKVKQLEQGVFDEDQAIECIKNFRAHENAYMIEPWGYETKIETPSGGLPDPTSMITHHNRMISSATLYQFSNLGQDASATGSYAQTEASQSFFTIACQAVVNEVKEHINPAIRELVNANWDVSKYPQLHVDNLQVLDLGELSDSLFKLAQASMMTPTGIEPWIRRKFGLPDIPESQQAIIKKPEIVPAIDDGQKQKLQLQNDSYKPWRTLRPEEKCLDIDGMYAKLTDREQSFTRIAKELRREQIKIMLSRGLKALMKKTDREFYDAVDEIKVPYWTRQKNELKGILREIYQYGKQEVKHELGRQGGIELQGEEFEPVEGDTASNRYLDKLAERSTEEINKGLLATLAFGLYGLHRQGRQDLTGLRTQLETRSDSEIKKAAGYAVSSAFNLGRNTEAQAQLKAGNIDEEAHYSAIMDENTCPQCRRTDGETIDIGSGRYYDLQPPLNSSEFGACSGGTRCRCIYVYITKKG